MSGAAQLTSSRRDVAGRVRRTAELTAEGLTSQAIAERCGVTARAVRRYQRLARAEGLLAAGQPCAAGCGRIVTPAGNRRPGWSWWCGQPECLRVRNRRRSQATRRRRGTPARDSVMQPCACGCGRVLLRVGARRPGGRWYGSDPACQLRRRRDLRAQRRAEVSAAPRPGETCELCGGPYYPTRGAASPDRLCSRAECRRERGRRFRERRRGPVQVQPCGSCGRPVQGRTRGRSGRTWWCDTDGCRKARDQANQAAHAARKAERRKAGRPPAPRSTTARPVPVDGAVAARAVGTVRLYVADPAEVAELLAMLGLDTASAA